MNNKTFDYLYICPPISLVEDLSFEDRNLYFHFLNPIGEGDWYVLGVDSGSGEILLLECLDGIRYTKKRIDEFLKMKLPFGFNVEIDHSFQTISEASFLASLKSF